MKNKLLCFVAVGFLTITFSCREENLLSENASQNEVKIEEGTVKNGRLYFPNRESLQVTYEKMKDAEDEAIANYVDSKNIISLRPVLTKNNENLIHSKIMKRIENLKNNKRYMQTSNALNKLNNEEEIADDIDDLEEIIGDDAFAAFLDSRAEIQIGNEIYKYTDVGLFVVPDSKYEKLKQYLEVKEISDDMLYRTDENVALQYRNSQQAGELLPVSDSQDIMYFQSRLPMNDNTTVVVQGGNTGNGGQTPSADEQMANYIKNLPNCEPAPSTFDFIFGDADKCIDRYEDRRRVKTKAYNYNYVLVYNLGAKVKHQYRGWTGIWRKEETDVMRIGVVEAQFFYDYTPYFTTQNINKGLTTVYNQNNKYLYYADSVLWSQNGLNVTGYSIAGFPQLLKDDIVIEKFIGNGTIYQGLNAAVAAGNKNLTSENLSKIFWQNTFSELNKFFDNIGKPRQNNNITVNYKGFDIGKVFVQKTFYNQANNEDKLEKTFDWGFQVGFNYDTTNANIKPDTSGNALKKPQNYRVTLYGIAKRNGQWHGSKINTIGGN